MTHAKSMMLAGSSLLAIAALMTALVIWPNYRQAASIRRQTAELRAKADNLSSHTAQSAMLAKQVNDARVRIDREFKLIPATPDLAGLIRKLSQNVDRVSVLDQTFIAGSQGEAIIGGKSTVQAMPLTVEMKATFDSVFALIQNAESMHRLVRVASVRLSLPGSDPLAGSRGANTSPGRVGGIIEGSVTLEAVFDPPSLAIAEGR